LTRTVQGCERYLRLERKLCHSWEIDVSKFKKLSQRLHLIFEAQICLFIDISEILHQYRLIHCEVLEQLISELQSSVQLDLELDLGRDHSTRKEVFEIVTQVLSIHSFDFSISHAWDHTDGVYVAFSSYKGNNVASYSLVFREITDFLVDIWLAPARSYTHIGGTICAYNNLGTEGSQTCESDRAQHAGTKSSTV
jgi:hypothetical protein